MRLGNILSISRSTLPANNALTILNLTPLRGKVGQTIAIQGQGFSTVAASNLVKFNGTTATVVTATASLLTVTVPAGAITGPLTLTVSGVTVSGGNFTVVGRTLVSIFVTPAGSTFRKADTLQLTAHGTYDDGLTEDVTNLVTWNSSDPTIASISNTSGSQGLATGVSATGGTVNITAASGGVSGSSRCMKRLRPFSPSLLHLCILPFFRVQLNNLLPPRLSVTAQSRM
jgi:hypothetical protein